jgi:CRISPR/Cas system-associated exonuclease Cas4 (RecB family)
LGSKKEAKDVFVNNLNPFFGNINTAHFCPNVKTFMTRLMTDSDPADSNDGNLVTTNQRSREEKYNEMKKQLAAAVETIEQLKKTKDKTKKQLTAALKTIEELKKKNP